MTDKGDRGIQKIYGNSTIPYKKGRKKTREFDCHEVLYIAIDRTTWRSINLLVISLIYQRRAIPIYFELLPAVGACSFDQQKAALSQVLELLKSHKKVVLGDRE